jgi:hypothetical protein
MVFTEGVISYLSVEEVGPLAEELIAIDRVVYWISEAQNCSSATNCTLRGLPLPK